MPKTKFQEFIFTFITSGCMIFIMGVYNVARTSGCYLQTRTAFFSHWNGSSGFSVHSSLPAKCPNTSHSAWQNQLTDQSSSSSASRPSQSVQWCRFIFRHLFASTNQGNESKVKYEMEQQGFAE